MAYETLDVAATGDPNSPERANKVRANFEILAKPPRCRVYNSANQAIGAAASTLVTFDSERYDTDTMHSTAVNTGRITFTTAGTYRVTGRIAFASGAGAYRELKLVLGGATPLDLDARYPAGGGNYTTLLVDTEYEFTAGQYVELYAYTDVALNVMSVGNYSPEFMARRVAV